MKMACSSTRFQTTSDHPQTLNSPLVSANIRLPHNAYSSRCGISVSCVTMAFNVNLDSHQTFRMSIVSPISSSWFDKPRPLPSCPDIM